MQEATIRDLVNWKQNLQDQLKTMTEAFQNSNKLREKIQTQSKEKLSAMQTRTDFYKAQHEKMLDKLNKV